MANNGLLQQIFSLPLADKQHLLYAPLKQFACIANPALINHVFDICQRMDNGHRVDLSNMDNEVLQSLVEHDFFVPKPEPVDEYAGTGSRYDTVVLFPGNECNLRCGYCYAAAGDFSPVTMSWDTQNGGTGDLADHPFS